MRIVVAKPRGFCAGVERAIKSVELALERFGKPVYVLNPIVHNRHVVNSLAERGAVFVKSIEEVPEGSILLFSAHGVGPECIAQSQARKLKIIDATCPLVDRVHIHARRYADRGYTVILIGDADHDETRGTLGWTHGRGILISTKEDAENLTVDNPEKLAYITQTTLSIYDCKEIVDILKRRFPNIESPVSSNICYATTNRQKAVQELVHSVDAVIVVGDNESANSKRLAELARSANKPTLLVLDASELHVDWFADITSVLITSGASVPEEFVKQVIDYIKNIEPSTVEEVVIVEEEVHFKLPDPLR